MSLKMERNKEIAKSIALAMKEAVKAERKAERAQKEADDEKKEAKDAEKKPAEDAAAKKDGAADKDAKAAPAEEEASEADKLASEESEQKAKKMIEFAKAKVGSIVDLYKELNGNIKEEMLQLEKILLDTKINAEFDPDSDADIEWVTGEVEKILIDVP